MTRYNCCCGQGRICPTHGDSTPNEQIDDGLKLPEASIPTLESIKQFLTGRKIATELYISPLGFNGGESWQVEINYGDYTKSFQAITLEEALSVAMKESGL